MEKMKSTPEQLRSRGYLSDAEFEKYRSASARIILANLASPAPHERTAAVRDIASSRNEEYIERLCEMLKSETKLYVRLEIASCLEGFGGKSIPYLIPLLSRIGTNQHAEAAIVDIGKKSYPLPRDLAARILIRLGPAVFPAIREVLRGADRPKILEAIDVAGHVAWNSHDRCMEGDLVGLYEKSSGDRMIVWKTVRAFRSFSSPRVAGILESLVRSAPDAVLKTEAERSLELLRAREG